MKSATIAVIGTINFDQIVAQGGESFESLGGILYNGLVLAAILEGTGIRARLHARLGAAHIQEARGLFDGYDAIDLGGLIADPNGTNVSRLDYSKGEEREEDVQLRVPPLVESDVRGVEDADVVLVNMISGRDVSLETLRSIRRGAGGRFFLDIQALARTLSSPRRSREVPDWREWTSLFDTIRGNETEVSFFAGCIGDPERAARRILEAGAKEALVTRGPRGSRRFSRDEIGAVTVEEVPPVERKGPVDSTGCGDAYDAAVCAGRALGLCGFDAALFGSYVGSEVAGVFGLRGLRELRGIRERAARFDPRFTQLLAK
jgi:sugar/nucleoside kinase (ribokinase family)